MDDTQQSRADAGATRKRRSSILKSQRPPRTPFSELEFNVATPTDTAKSRRVSFSRRTGVAEFVTNEATTTWKNFYEEHNKSLESSGNDTDINGVKQTVSHIGKRLFDQQFEEVEAVELMGILNPGCNTSSSINNINFTLECTDKLTAPKNNFELSAFTENQSKLFGDDLAIPCGGEVSDHIDVNFSAIHQIGGKDDLDDIQKDLQRAQSNAICQGPFDRQNMSEYIEVDLNCTNFAMRYEESDNMSITDTVHSPKVQDVSKSSSIDKKVTMDNDWASDKENIAINPYAAPQESLNFAVNDEPDQVLVFDGKRLTIQTENSSENYRKILLPDPHQKVPQRKTIVLNCNDDLPNFIENPRISKNVYEFAGDAELKQSMILDDDMSIKQGKFNESENKQRTVFYDDLSLSNISVTQALPSKVIQSDVEKRRTIVYENDTGNISVTQALPAKIINNTDKRRTIVYEKDTGNISITQAVSSNVIIPEKRKTTKYENDQCDISMTETLPANIMPEPSVANKRRTIVYEDGRDNVSITQAVPNIVIKESKGADKRRTIVYEDETGDISVTQAISSNIILPNTDQPERRRTVVFESSTGNISVTQAVSSNFILAHKFNATSYEDDVNISMTQAIPAKILENYDSNRRRTVVYENDTGNLSITQAVPSSQVIVGLAQQNVECGAVKATSPNQETDVEEVTNKRRTLVFENDDADISMTQAVNLNQILPGLLKKDENPICEIIPNTEVKDELLNKRRTVVFDNEDADISMTQAVSTNLIAAIINEHEKDTSSIEQKDTSSIELATNAALHSKEEGTNKRRTVFDADISVTQAVNLNKIIPGLSENKEDIKSNDLEVAINKALHGNEAIDNRRKTIVYDDVDISMTQAIPANIIVPKDKENRRTIVFEDSNMAQALPAHIIAENRDIFMEIDSLTGHQEPKQIHDVSMTEEKKSDQPKITIKYENECKDISQSQLCNLSVSKPIPSSLSTIESELEPSQEEKRTKKVNEFCYSSVSKSIPSGLSKIQSEHEPSQQEEKRKTKVDELCNLSVSKPIPSSLSTIQSELEPSQEEKRTTKVDELCNSSVSKPIPSSLSTIQSEHEPSNTNLDIFKQNGMLGDLVNAVSDILVYQAVTAHSTTLPNSMRTEQSTSRIQERLTEEIEDEKISSTTTATDEIENTTSQESVIMSSEIQTPNDSDHNVREISTETSVKSILSGTETEEMKDVAIATESPKKSILVDLLDMSSACMLGDGIDDKNLTVEMESKPSSPVNSVQPVSETNSNDTLFYITRDGDEDVESDKFDENKELKVQEMPKLRDNSPPALEYKEQQPSIVDDLKKKTHLLKSKLLQDDEKNIKNRHYEKVRSTDMKSKDTAGKNKLKDLNVSKERKSFKLANDTNELLDMLSDFTDKPVSKNVDPPLEEDEHEIEPVMIKGYLALENKTEPEREPRRISFAAKRQSIVMSREDLLNNISMASAALQKSRFEFSDSDADDSAMVTPAQNVCVSHKNPVRLSTDVCKTLHFDEESIISDISALDKATSLKKTVFGETSYMKDTKAKVIPDYLKNISDGIKELMDDLVKPMPEVIPFEGTGLGNTLKKTTSTCSTQIQANLVTSSQIDLNVDLISDFGSTYNMEKMSSGDMINDAINRSVSSALKCPIESVTIENHSNKSLVMDTSDVDIKLTVPSKPKGKEQTGRVLIFDHNNPLNNVFLATPHAGEVHKYNPAQTNNSLRASDRSHSEQISLSEKDNEYEAERVSPQYNTDSNLTIPQSAQQSGHSGYQIDTQGVISNISKPMSIDQFTQAKTTDVKDTEVNTVIVMKGNRELLEATSSLTLVDDALARSTVDFDIMSRTTTHQADDKKISPVKVIFKIEEDAPKDSDVTSNEYFESEKDVKPKKRIYSPTKRDKHKHCIISNLEVTPKPISKMQKLSNSPNNFRATERSVEKLTKLTAEKDENDQPERLAKAEKPSLKLKSKKPGTEVTVQELLTEYKIEAIDHDSLNQQIKEVLEGPKSESSAEPKSIVSESSLVHASSFTSSKNLRDDISVSEVASSKSSRMDWQQDLEEMTSKNVVMECDSSANVVAKIDMLPFMGSHECEWESSCGDTWAFRLLHSRIRLTVKLAHRHDNAARTRVRADTPVLSAALEVLPQDKKNHLATLCVSFAAEAMRHHLSRGCACAGAVPALVRRLAGAARLAARWARAMHDARLRLAYTLSADGWLSLKVANIPLRSVWEVKMQLELVVEDANKAPWPRAHAVRVERVVSDVPVAEQEVRRALGDVPGDWGHVPRTVWRIFKYLKHKPRDDELLGLQYS